MKKIIILGASGSIGKQTVDICLDHQDELKLVAVSIGKNVAYAKELLNKIDLEYICLKEKNDILEKEYPDTKFLYGDEGLLKLSSLDNYDLLVNALVGFVGLKPTICAIENNKDIALANKETLVVAGDIINKALKEHNVTLYPIDSEHSAIFQCLNGNLKKDVKRLIITGSGGSFRKLKREELKNVSLNEALNHPVWSMGQKITIDSATMMNKGYEVIEAHYLFDIPYDKIDVILHDESIVHSMVEYNDGSVMAQMGNPDMHVPIQYAILYPRHEYFSGYEQLDLAKISTLHFKEMDYDRYPMVKIAKLVGEYGGNLGAVLNAANDTAVKLFLDGKIKFLDIELSIIKALLNCKAQKEVEIDDVINTYKWAENFVLDMWSK